MADLVEMRRLLEPEAAAMVARRAPRSERERLLAVADGPAAHSLSSLIEFHAELGKLSGNGLMTLFLGSLRDIVATRAGMPEASAPTLEAAKRAHIQIARAIAGGDPAAAQRAMARHLRTCIEDIGENEGPDEAIVSVAGFKGESGLAG